RAWASLFEVTCAVDGSPLFEWPATASTGTRALPLASERTGHRSLLCREAIRYPSSTARWVVNNGNDPDVELLHVVARFARDLRKALFDLSVGPEDWRGTEQPLGN